MPPVPHSWVVDEIEKARRDLGKGKRPRPGCCSPCRRLRIRSPGISRTVLATGHSALEEAPVRSWTGGAGGSLRSDGRARHATDGAFEIGSRRVLRFLLAGMLLIGQAEARDEPRAWRMGIETGFGTVVPFGNTTYRHTALAYRLLFNTPLGSAGALGYELQLEPSFYVAQHRLLNPLYVPTLGNPGYEAQRSRYARGETTREYALNVGLVGRYRATERLSFFVLVSTGPEYSDTATERLAKGLAFSDVVGLGAGYRFATVLLEMRVGLRHASNAHLKYPNGGNNDATIDLSLSR